LNDDARREASSHALRDAYDRFTRFATPLHACGQTALYHCRNFEETAMTDTERIVRQAFQAYETGDGEGLHALLADDFHFSAPSDAALDRAGYMERCWPFRTQKPCYSFGEFFIRGNQALVLYNCKRATGTDIQNVEYFLVEGGRLKQVTVFFGPPVNS
jgi:hypothetical protein